MLAKVTIRFSPEGQEETVAMLEAIINAVAECNAILFRKYPASACCPGCGGVRYKAPCPEKAAKREIDWATADVVLAEGVTACGPAAAYVAGHKLAAGEHARVRVLPRDETGRDDYHAVVELANGAIEDPTAELEKLEGGCNCEGV